MKQATQLPIPFADLDPATRPEPSQATGAADTHFLYFEGAELRALSALSQAAAKASSKAKALIPSIILFAQATLCVLFGFGLMFFAAIIGG